MLHSDFGLSDPERLNDSMLYVVKPAILEDGNKLSHRPVVFVFGPHGVIAH